jgi:hypothetical protein
MSIVLDIRLKKIKQLQILIYTAQEIMYIKILLDTKKNSISQLFKYRLDFF